MVSACKSYITEQGEVRVWDVATDILLERFKSCHTLLQHYQDCFQHAKERAQNANRSFEVSEMYVFGKFSSFCRRIVQIQEMATIIEHFSVLKESRIEGIDTLATRFGHIVSAVKKRPYNPLDHRKMEFVVDFEEFQRQVSELEDQLCNFMSSIFSLINSTLQSLKMLKR